MRLQSEETSETIEIASQNLFYSRFPTIWLVSCLVLVKYQQLFPTIITSSAFCSATPSELYILSRTGADYIPQPSCNKSFPKANFVPGWWWYYLYRRGARRDYTHWIDSGKAKKTVFWKWWMRKDFCWINRNLVFLSQNIQVFPIEKNIS